MPQDLAELIRITTGESRSSHFEYIADNAANYYAQKTSAPPPAPTPASTPAGQNIEQSTQSRMEGLTITVPVDSLPRTSRNATPGPSGRIDPDDVNFIDDDYRWNMG